MERPAGYSVGIDPSVGGAELRPQQPGDTKVRGQTGALLALIVAVTSVSTASGPEPYEPTQFFPVFDGVESATASESVNLAYHGGSVQVLPSVYLVFWGWFGVDPAGEAPYLIRFLEGIGGSTWASTLTQYGEDARGNIENPAGQLAGIWWDDALPIDGGLMVLPENVQGEVQRAVDHFGHRADANYIVAVPTLRNDPHFAIPGGFCAYHSRMTDTSFRKVAFTYLPYIPDAPAGACGANFVNPGVQGLLDGVSIVVGHEYAETITDPRRGSGWLDDWGQEIGDKCVWIQEGPGAAYNTEFTTGTFAVQTLWSNVAGGCGDPE